MCRGLHHKMRRHDLYAELVEYILNFCIQRIQRVGFAGIRV